MPGDIIENLQIVSKDSSTDVDLRNQIDKLILELQGQPSLKSLMDAYGKSLSNFNSSVARDIINSIVPMFRSVGKDVLNALEKTSDEVRELAAKELSNSGGNRNFQRIYRSVTDPSRLDEKALKSYVGSVLRAMSSSVGENVFRSIVDHYKEESLNIEKVMDRIEKDVYRLVSYEESFNKKLQEVQKNIKTPPSDWKASTVAYQRLQASRELKDIHPTESRTEAQIAKNFQEASNQEGLTRSEKNRIKYLQSQYDNAKTLVEREKVGRVLDKESEDFGKISRSITVADRALLEFDSHFEDYLSKFREFAKGTPAGWNAVFLGIAFAAKELMGFIDGISDTITNMAELDIQAAHTKATFDSMFGSKQYDQFRDSLALTRREMLEFSRTAMEAYRSQGVEMERTMLIAENIRNQFGQLDTGKLQEALSIMEELTTSQTSALMGGGTGEDIANMYASLAKSRKAGRAADLLEQGVFGGDPLLESLNDRDKEIIRLQREATKHLEDMSHGLKDLIPGVGSVLAIEKYASTGVSLISKVVMAVSGFRLLTSLMKGASSKNSIEIPDFMNLVKNMNMKPTGSIGNALGKGGGLVSKLGGWGTIGGVAGGLAITGAATLGLNYFQKKAERKIQERDEFRKKEQNDAYSILGLASGSSDFGIDEDKIHATALKYSKWGAGIGGTIGTIGGSFASPVGSVVGGTVGTTIGGGAGYTLGEKIERERQMKKFNGNALFMDANGNVDKKAINSLVTSASMQKQLVEFAKKEQKERAISLRSIERTQIAIERVAKGMYTSNADANIALAKRSIEIGATVGGSAGGYSLNIASIMDNNVKAFSSSIGILNSELEQAANDMNIDEESRLQKTRDILTAQADVTEKFVSTMMENIGEYEKIPDVIVNSIKNKINQMHLDFRNENFGGTAEGNLKMLTDNLARDLESFSLSLEQSNEDQKKVQEALATLDKSREALTKNISQGVDLEGYDRNVIVNGRVNREAVLKNGELIKSLNSGLEKDILSKYGIDDTTQSLFDKARSSQDEIMNLQKEYSGMKAEDFTPAKQKEFYEKLVKAATSTMGSYEEIASSGVLQNNKYMRNVASLANTDAASLSKDIDKLNREQNNPITLDTAMQMIGKIAGTNQGMSEYLGVMNRAKNDTEFKERSQKIKRAETIQTQAGALTNNEVAANKAIDKMQTSLIEELRKIQNTAVQIANQVSNSPMARLESAAKEILEVESASLLQDNRYSDYLTKSLDIQNSLISDQKDALDKSRAALEKNDKDLFSRLDKIPNQKHLDDNTKEELSLLKSTLMSYREAQLGYLKNPTTANREMIQTLAGQINTIRGRNAGNLAFESNAQQLESFVSANVGAHKEIISGEKKILSDVANMVEQSLQNFGRYRDAGRYKAVSGRQEMYSSRAEYYGQLNRPDMTREMYGEMLSAAREKFGLSRQGIMDTYAEGMKALQERSKNMSPSQYRESSDRLYSKMIQDISQAQKTLLDETIRASRIIYDQEKQRIDLVRESVDIQADYLSSIGAPFQEILRVEQMRVDLTDKNYHAALENFRRISDSGERGVEYEKAKNELQRASAEKMKAAYGAQNSALEKMFGNMIGAFSDIAGIIAPNNLAAKYGMGYTQGQNGTVFNTGKGGPGLEGRKLAANFGVGDMTSEVIGSSTSLESLSAETLEQEKKSNDTLSSIKTSLDKISEKVVGKTPEGGETPKEKGATPKRKDAPKKVNDKVYEIKARWDKESQKVSQDAEGVKTVGSARARRKEIEAQASLGDQTSDAVSVDRMLGTADDLALSPIQAAETESEFDKYKRLQKESQQEKDLLAKASAMTPAEAARRKAHSSYFNKTEKNDPAQSSGVAESSAIALEIKPATVTISFNSDMFEKKVIEIIGREIKKGTA